MKFTIRTFMICTICIAICIGVIMATFVKRHPKKALLYIEDHLVDTQYAYIYQTYETVPLIDVLSFYGFDVKWIDDVTAFLTKEGQTLYLSLLTCELIYHEVNLLLPAPGRNDYHCENVQNNIILDLKTAICMLKMLGIQAHSETNYRKGVIYIRN